MYITHLQACTRKMTTHSCKRPYQVYPTLLAFPCVDGCNRAWANISIGLSGAEIAQANSLVWWVFVFIFGSIYFYFFLILLWLFTYLLLLLLNFLLNVKLQELQVSTSLCIYWRGACCCRRLSLSLSSLGCWIGVLPAVHLMSSKSHNVFVLLQHESLPSRFITRLASLLTTRHWGPLLCTEEQASAINWDKWSKAVTCWWQHQGDSQILWTEERYRE